MLSNSKEMPVALKLIEYKFIPCLLLLRQAVEGQSKKVKVEAKGCLKISTIDHEVNSIDAQVYSIEAMITVPLKSESVVVDIDVIHTKLSDYLTRRNKEIDEIPANIGNRPAKFNFPPAGESRVKKLQQLEREREMKEMQERKYYEMLSEETAKAEQAELAKIEEVAKAKEKAAKQEGYEKMVEELGKSLAAEPGEGESRIQVAFRLPSGLKLTRFFRMAEPVRVVELLTADAEGVYVPSDIAVGREPHKQSVWDLQVEQLNLGEVLTFKYDHPPKPISESEMEKSFEEFFGGSARELIQVEDEALHKD